jgi:hypothetical protein
LTAPIPSAERRRIPMLDFETLSQTLAGKTVLCIGDIMRDVFV